MCSFSLSSFWFCSDLDIVLDFLKRDRKYNNEQLLDLKYIKKVNNKKKKNKTITDGKTFDVSEHTKLLNHNNSLKPYYVVKGITDEKDLIIIQFSAPNLLLHYSNKLIFKKSLIFKISWGYKPQIELAVNFFFIFFFSSKFLKLKIEFSHRFRAVLFLKTRFNQCKYAYTTHKNCQILIEILKNTFQFDNDISFVFFFFHPKLIFSVDIFFFNCFYGIK